MGKLSGTRRDVLRKGAAAIGAATIASSAGCMGILGGGGDYTQWLPEPGTLSGEDHYSVSSYALSALAEHEDEFADGTDLSVFENSWAPASIDWDEVETLVSFNGVRIVQADFERDEIIEDFEDEDYDEEDEYEGYTLMLGPDERRMGAVGDGTLILTGGGYEEADGPEEAIEIIVDTSNGDEDRYVDENDAFSELTGKLGGGDITSGFTMEAVEEGAPERGRFENQVAQGDELSVNGEESDGKWVIVYEEEDDVDVDDVEDWVEASQDTDNGELADWDDVEVNKNGRTAVVKATADTDDI